MLLQNIFLFSEHVTFLGCYSSGIVTYWLLKHKQFCIEWSLAIVLVSPEALSYFGPFPGTPGLLYDQLRGGGDLILHVLNYTELLVVMQKNLILFNHIKRLLVMGGKVWFSHSRFTSKNI